MTTTHDVPMPDCGTILVGREEVSLGHSDEAMRAYADARCAKLQEAANIWRSTADGIAALCAQANEEIDELKTERDEAWRAYHDCQEVAIRLTCEADTAALQRDALAEKVKELQDKLDHCYDLLKNNDTDIRN